MIRIHGRARAAACAFCAACLCIASAGAQAPARKQHQAVRIGGAAPQVDGRLDDAAWAAAPVMSDFVQKEPVEGAAPVDRTEVRFLYDDDALYVGARMYARDPRSMTAPISRRDNGGQAERLLVSLDTYLDRRTAYTFGVTAAGVRLDYYHGDDQQYNRDASFNPVWSAQARMDSAGWTAEMRIPFSQLRFNDLPVQLWGINLNRYVPSREEDVYWIAVPRGVEAWSSRFGELTGIRGVRPSRRIELVPYVAAEGTRRGQVDADDPFARARSGTVRAGGDARIGLGSSLTLEATLNPDFGQVEADPAEVNLSAFETFFAERRPFFTEGSRYLAADGPRYFYSRRIGAAPRARVDADYVDEPRNSTILGAAKLTGRTQRGLSLGALAAVTDEANARFVNEDGEIRSVRLAPRTAWGVVRAAQEFGANASVAGINFSAVQRGTEAGGLDAAWLPRTAVSGGADWKLRLRGGDYEVGGFVGGSMLRGDTAAIRRVQSAPAHFFQRPDRDYAVLDPARTGLNGYTAGVSLERRNARHWLWGVGVSAISPGFDVNETGRMQVADYSTADGEIVYRETQPSGAHRGYEIELETENGWDYQGLRRHGNVSLGGGVTWANYWHTQGGVRMEMRRLDASATRGGPRLGFGRAVVADLGVRGPQTSLVRWSAGAKAGRDAQGGREWGVETSAAMNPGPNWQIALEPYYERDREARQYVARLAGGPEATQGVRYVFSAIDRSTLAAPVRISYTVTPDLSVEVYAEPFAASGRYSRFGQVPRGRSFTLDPLDDTEIVACRTAEAEPCSPGAHVFLAGDEPETIARDFNVRSLRSNTVLRWEWRPGSTLFLVWQQDRSSALPYGDAVGPRALGDLFEVPGNNFVALKMTYWLPVR
ncbi:MAG TPA: DUF5916 domain-containing protein [Longimicrobium sp.]|uniref:DUF5916 domain-containing protein n=1 Tax=Longimicrobium sp. TaxID=2029185 RepID=UPI002EDB3A65